MALELHPAAEAEARAAFLRYRAIDAAVAERFIGALDRAIDRVASAPNRFPVYLLGTRRLLLHRFPFAVIYRTHPQRTIVVAIAHQSRRPGYWSKRRSPI